MTPSDYQIVSNGDSAFSILFSESTGEQLSQKIISLVEQIRKQLKNQVIDVIPAYQSLTVSFNPLTCDRNQLENALIKVMSQQTDRLNYQQNLIEIPVCYEADYALDIEHVSEYCGLDKNAIIERHVAPEYLVHMLGFSPGFLYLGGLDQQIHCPRKQNPTTRVPAGSVGIGGSQTGIYPQATPGGWQIIGRTPLNIFNPAQQSPCIASPLDRVKFVPISTQQFEKMQQT